MQWKRLKSEIGRDSSNTRQVGCSATLAHDELAFQKIQLRGILAFCKGKNPMNPSSVFQVIGTY